MFFEYYRNFALFIDHLDKPTAAVYMILAKILSGITFIPGTPLTILAGVIFGTFWGTIISLVGNLMGACGAFMIARYLFKDFVQKKVLMRYPSLDKYEDRLFKKGFTTVLVLRLLPIFPFNFLNFALAVTEVKFKDFFLGSFFGMIPGTIIFVHFGETIKMFTWINFFVSCLFVLFCLFFLCLRFG
jgi:uncharacterized membrane protein YdjX (TVP38/TMEM64 family)